MDDYVDEVIESWHSVRPDVDTDPIAVITRILRAAQEIQLRLDGLIGADPRLSHKGDLDTLNALRRSGPGNALIPTQLASVGQLTSGGMTNRLDRLEAAGLIEREPHPDDRRSVLVSLTAAGTELADDAFAATMALQERLLSPLDAKDRTELGAALKQLLLSFGDVPVGIST
jgi:DNA-binding MarR family transcriptional regulator